MIHYEVNAKQPESHLFQIRMTLPPGLKNAVLSMPNWIPGSYLIRDFAKHIVSIQASVLRNGKMTNIALQKTSSNTWVCANTNDSIVVEYTVYAWDLSVRGAHLDQHHAFFNPCCLFLQVDSDLPCQVTLNPPNCSNATSWKVATTMRPLDAQRWGFGRYQATNYEELIDHPVEMGNFDIIEFEVANIPHAIVVSGKHDGDLNRLAQDVKKICQANGQLFENDFPFSQYLFLLTVTKDGYGGLEHCASSALLAPRDLLPVKNDAATSREYITLLALFSHEYFHAWNIKRIKPERFVPYNLNDKGYTTQLWAFEGITSYYDELALLRAKAITLEQYLDLLAQTLTRVLRAPGNLVQTLADASFDAWIKYYAPNENSINTQSSYYLKGSLIALAFDLIIRANTSQQKSLDNVMRTLWQEYGKNSIGVPEGKIESLIVQEGTQQIEALVLDAIYSTKILPMDKLLAPFGLALSLRQQINAQDMGGKKANNDASFRSGVFQFNLSKSQTRLMVLNVIENGAAMQSGISAMDEIVALNDIRVDADSFDKIAKRLAIGEKVKVHFFRQDLLKETTVTLAAPPYDTVQISVMENISEEQKRNLQAWLKIESM
ncbi:MAG: M61 family metallopeptidase [Candidatus Berkiella sp.]